MPVQGTPESGALWAREMAFCSRRKVTGAGERGRLRTAASGVSDRSSGAGHDSDDKYCTIVVSQYLPS